MKTAFSDQLDIRSTSRDQQAMPQSDIRSNAEITLYWVKLHL